MLTPPRRTPVTAAVQRYRAAQARLEAQANAGLAALLPTGPPGGARRGR